MSELYILARNSWREQIRGRFFTVALIFGGLMLYMSLLLGMLAADQELRVLMDFGLSFIEVLASVAVAYTAATGILREMETKTIYLVLTRPVSKSGYILGRYFGLLASGLFSVALMGLVHVSLLWAKGWALDGRYLLALGGVALKIVVTASLATLLTLISTSVLSALCMSGISWMLGNFVSEMRYMSTQAAHGLTGKALMILIYLLPNLQLFNFRDRLDLPSGLGPGEPVLFAVFYAAAYASLCLGGALALFRRKEF